MNILVFNPGSSSLRFGCYEVSSEAGSTITPAQSFGGHVERIGTEDTQITRYGSSRKNGADCSGHAGSCGKEIIEDIYADLLDLTSSLDSVDAIACRVVHGGDSFIGPELITDRVLKEN